MQLLKELGADHDEITTRLQAAMKGLVVFFLFFSPAVRFIVYSSMMKKGWIFVFAGL